MPISINYSRTKSPQVLKRLKGTLTHPILTQPVIPLTAGVYYWSMPRDYTRLSRSPHKYFRVDLPYGRDCLNIKVHGPFHVYANLGLCLAGDYGGWSHFGFNFPPYTWTNPTVLEIDNPAQGSWFILAEARMPYTNACIEIEWFTPPH